MKKGLMIALILAVVTGGFTVLAEALPPFKIVDHSKAPQADVKKTDPPLPGKLAATIGLNLKAGHKEDLSSGGMNALYGPARPLSQDKLRQMKDQRLKKIQSRKAQADLAQIPAGLLSPVPPGAMAAANQLINPRDYWLEDEYSTVVTQSEVSAAVFGSHIVASWNDFVTDFFGPYGSMTNWGVSHDGGSTFATSVTGLPTYGAGITQTWGDPAVDVDQNGVFYLATMSQFTSDGIDYSGLSVYRSFDSGNTFVPWLSIFTGNNDFFFDKEFIAIDRNRGKVYLTFTNFGPLDVSILCWNMTDGYLTQVAQNDTGLQGSIPAVDTFDGALYVVYKSRDLAGLPHIMLRKSADFGNTFGAEIDITGPFTPVEDDPARSLGSASDFCGRSAIKGNIRLSEMPSMAVDTRLSGNGAGYVYVVYNGRDAVTNFLNVYITYSWDGGTSWTVPEEVNLRADATSSQPADTSDKFYPWVTVTGTGRVGVLYYDRKITPGNKGVGNDNWWLAAYMRRFTVSSSGFLTANGNPYKVSPDFPAVVNNDFAAPCYMGEYNSIAANRQSADNYLHMFWGDARLGDFDIRYYRK